ncbi:MAG: hypothetical protein IPJ65_26580 [Archangiaceae bacterium]|nr:hypothetical protein [Archangiaceae bacterium]
MSVSATTFAASARTAADLARFFSESPVEAADYALRFARAAGLSGATVAKLEELTAFEDPTQREAGLLQFAQEQQAAFSAFDLAQTQAARAATLGFSAGPAKPVQLTGKISLATVAGNTDLPRLTTPDGKTWQLKTPAIAQTGGQHLWVQHRYLEANCLKAFDGMTVTVRAYATTTPEVLAVQSFAPGTPPDFVSGRLALVDGKLLLRVAPDSNVEITDPALVKRLSPFGNLDVGNPVGGRLGIILPGPLTERDGKLFYDGAPDDYWMLAKQTPGNPMLELAHGQRHPFIGDVSAEAKFADQRIFVFGHIDEAGKVVSSRKGALPMPPAIFEDGVEHVSEAGELAKLVPVQALVGGDFSGA